MISTPSTIYVFAALLAAATNSGLVSAQSLPYGLCNKANFQYSTIVGTPAATFPIAQIPLVTTSGAPLTVKGSIRIVDGCTFSAIDFQLIGAVNAYWYGGAPNSNEGVTIVDAQVPASPTAANFTYTLTQVAGRQVNWSTFTIMRLLDRADNNLLATVQLPGQLGASAGTTTPAGPTTGAGTTTGPSPPAGSSPATKSGSISDRQIGMFGQLYQGVATVLAIGAALTFA
ncbi:hypothetical protein BASA50_000642 [Batrachochytrium salamandrivorans]|uniref:DM13 domain-containing protein n=1 Tax=Batrachochytrium salamandrivorans TaxID=1357716 RepID=A0ABQ8ET65_9FUNG|nr:hypothetical protein BASA62_009628 [Batrachochytrium salamandrivorans]KAH6578233.1 hypothetical protein BASA60_003717 [Batrachochytrium salamandrivorans]KAH6586177.1 hypothetical protein BASA50_000642 [Batrachochytrium salamandrivorans]KAH6594333.1 hypothetical protein BASA61_004021 [Batrachochytrium salamandrivorans]KAH9245414.1 hypothetical protein BASA81_017123 [Batrachochytrium salamandrivorans]